MPGKTSTKQCSLSRDEAEQIMWERTHDTEWVTRAMQAAVRKALLRHKHAGNPIPVARDGKVEVIPASEIRLPKPVKRSRTPCPDDCATTS